MCKARSLSAMSAGDYRTQLHAKAAAVANALTGDDGYDFAFLHVKAVDDTGHDRDTVLKVAAACSNVGFYIGFTLLHVKAVDDTGHDRDTVLKVTAASVIVGSE